ncbi:MAG: TetR/AcrR family transcriptional regulator [Hyphomicrobiales bacterium]|nr:MAG: TetR/AcrR family transcriptional regulator [Hyphomicrobiales bacterium]
MTNEISGRGDPLKTLQLLWHGITPPKRGPRPKVTLQALVNAAIAIADKDGLDAVSTRRVAEAVGISPMSFYTYVPGKAELLDLMLDAVSGDPEKREPPAFNPTHWRANVKMVAGTLFDYYLAHPWVLEFATHRPVMGPNMLRSYESALSAFDGIGLSDLEIDRAFAALANYVYGAVRDAAREKIVRETTGMSDDEWWGRVLPFLETIDYSPYPVTSRVGPVAGEHHGAHDPLNAFAFGLDCMLDGLELYISRKAGRPATG